MNIFSSDRHLNNFAILDLETTGFGKTDRIVELGLVIVQENEIINEWETLVNPERDISNSDIHGISSEMVSIAPTFEELIDELSELLNEKILVAHNLSFDSRMLIQEFNRIKFNINPGSGFCTLRASNLKLEQACEKYKITNYKAHSALSDAKATAELFLKIFSKNEKLSPIKIENFEVSNIARKVSRSAFDSENKINKKFKKKLRSIDLKNEREPELSYLDALSYFFSDLYLNEEELNQLKNLADDLGLSETQRNNANLRFFEEIVKSATRDDYLNVKEVQAIENLSKSFGLNLNKDIFKKAESGIVKFFKGMKVCFTGESKDTNGNIIERAELFKIAEKNSLIPVETVTKKSCDLLVAADKSSMSGKAKKARDYGITVISTQEFLKLLENEEIGKKL